MASVRSATRYTNSLKTSTKSDPSSSAEFPASSCAVTKKQDSIPAVNFSSMVKKLVDNKKTKIKEPKFVVAADFLAEDLRKNAKKGTGLSGLHKKLFKGSTGVKRGEESAKKALSEVKGNTRTLAMVLRSERELLSLNKEQQEEIDELKMLVEERNREVEKLKDLCLKQREEIKSLKSSILFPDVMNSHIHNIVEKQGSELKQANQLIPSLQRQVSSLTGQLQCLTEDLAEVKAGKYSGRGFCDNHFGSPRALSYDQHDGANSLEFSFGDYTSPKSSDDKSLTDFNPCLTPYYARMKSKDFEGYDSPDHEGKSSRQNREASHGGGFNICAEKLSRSSDCYQPSRSAGTGFTRASRMSDGNKSTYAKQMRNKIFR